jgi:hypothetical protein
MGAALIATLIATLNASLMGATLVAATLIATLIATLTATTMGHGTSLLMMMMMHFDPIVSGLRGKRIWTVASPGAATHSANPASICVSKMGIGWICAARNIGLQNGRISQWCHGLCVDDYV